MGGAPSRFAETDWEAADGGLRTGDETVDNSKPIPAHNIFCLTKHSLVNQREFDVRDDQNIVIYDTKAVDGTVKWFDLVAGTASGDGNRKLLRVEVTDLKRRKWDVFAYGAPAFPGQAPDPDATAKAGGEPLFKKVLIDVAWDRHHATVYRYGKEGKPTTSGAGDNGGGGAVADPSGTVVDDPILKVEEVQSVTAEYQTYLPPRGLLGAGGSANPEPLVGFWVWEHTPNTHRIKLHVAKNSDLALHVVLAVMTNMVKLERVAT